MIPPIVKKHHEIDDMLINKIYSLTADIQLSKLIVRSLSSMLIEILKYQYKVSLTGFLTIYIGRMNNGKPKIKVRLYPKFKKQLKELKLKPKNLTDLPKSIIIDV